MFTELGFGIASLFAQEQEILHEQLFQVPAGIEYRLNTDSFDWNAVTLFSVEDEDLPEIEYLSQGGEWIDWHHEHVGDEEDSPVLELLHFPERTDQITIRSEEALSLVGHFYNTLIDDERLTVSAFNPFESDGAEDQLQLFAEENNIVQPKFYSRVDWGADERLRLSSVVKRLFTRTTSGLPSEIDDFPTRFKPKIIQSDLNGKPLSWPVAEMPQVYKMVIHHTGEYVDPEKEQQRDPRAVMRSIYYYHTITLGWGDIGYHYVIDKRGNIYEGRAGGPKAIGAHVAYHNAGSIGVSLMGNFQIEDPSDSQMHSLILLLADHADRFNIDPEGRSYYLNTLSDNISGHRDVTSHGRGTACPGEKLHAKLPYIREKVVDYSKIIHEGKRYKNTTRNILQKSVKAPNQQPTKRFQREVKEAALTVQDQTKPTVLQRNGRGELRLSVKNNTDFLWPTGVAMEAKNVPEGLSIGKIKSIAPISAGKSGIFTAKVLVQKTPNGKYALSIDPTFLKSRLNEISYKKIAIDYPLQISGDRNLLTRVFNRDTGTIKSPTSSGFSLRSLQSSSFSPLTFGNRTIKSTVVKEPRTTNEPVTKIKLAEFDEKYALISSDKTLYMFDGKKLIQTIPAQKEIRLILREESSRSYVVYQDGLKSTKISSVLLQTDGILKIHNYDRGINRSVPFNRFRSDLRIYPDDKKLLLVNELPLEEYLYGLAEETGAEPEEKRKAILVLARSYATVYGQSSRRKFKTNRYDLEDSPKTSQLYLGYDWEKYHSTQQALVKATEGEILTHQGFPVIGPYFTQSGGHSSNAWKRQYPWAKARPLPYDEGLEAKGHGIGLSGNSARELAKQGKNYHQIIDYFFDSVEVEKSVK